MTDQNIRWYSKDPAAIFASFSSSPEGLSREEARNRLQRYGYNELTFKPRSALLRLLAQFNDPLVYVLLIAAAVTAFLREWPDTIVIVSVVVVNVLIGFIQEGKAESSIEALRKMMVPRCTVIRGGRKEEIHTREVVPGDVVSVEAGNRVPADLRLFQLKNLSVDESVLTGESTSVNKDISSIEGENVPLGDQVCMLFSGTFVSRGTGLGVVTATGRETEFGKIAQIMKETPETSTPLTRKIHEFVRLLMTGIAAAAVLNFLLAVFFKYTFVYAFLASVSLAVAAIPEMLPAIIVAILALAARAMATRNALIRKLPAAETLGSTTVICSDKTGTLTRNEMTVKRVFCGGLFDPPAGLPELRETLFAGLACNDSQLIMEEGRRRGVGDPTETALLVSADNAGLTKKPRRIDEIPFESVQQYMATLHPGEKGNVIYVKGSPEKILSMCSSMMVKGISVPLRREEVTAAGSAMAADALRVLAMARKEVPGDKNSLVPDDLEGMTFLGLQGMIDPPREEVIDAVEKCRKAGIRVIMMTGDHAQTARAIASQIGIAGKDHRVLAGEELSAMSDEELFRALDEVSVFARIAPSDKLRITQQLQKKGNIVAVTGDGVNDAPALKAADIGIAMGITGTEVSKEAADIVLADDNFASIVAAVEEGRHAWNNFRKAVLYTLPTNGGQALLIMGAILMAPLIPVFSQRLPLEPIMILWINLADSVFLTMPLMMEPKEKGLLLSPPRSLREKIADRLFLLRVGVVSLIMAATGFFVYCYFAEPGDPLRLSQAQTAAFISVQFLHIGYLFTARRIYRSAFTFSPFSNRWLLAGVGMTLVTALLMVYWPVCHTLFRTAAFPAHWWIAVGLSLFPGFLAIELEKFLAKKRG